MGGGVAEISITVINSLSDVICYESTSQLLGFGLFYFYFLEETDQSLNSLEPDFLYNT